MGGVVSSGYWEFSGGWMNPCAEIRMPHELPHVVGFGRYVPPYFWPEAEIGVPGVVPWVLVYVWAVDKGEYEDREWLKGVVTDGEKFYEAMRTNRPSSLYYWINDQQEVCEGERIAAEELLIS